ncbi:unnamed protein product [Allacma fusca]|uniref:Uncharacterized protein n=1 Tax=Allacma fusca TaxID=39272 RepID=A0A8J2PQF4_9HEXA|nr:unnamed protein product [Allacma fusca]
MINSTQKYLYISRDLSFTKILKGDPTITNSSVSAAYGDTCVLTDFNDPNVLTVCDTLNTHLVCYRDNKCACLDVPRLLIEFVGSIPWELALQITILRNTMENMGLIFFSSYLEPSINRCVLKETSTCLREQVSLEDLLGPIPGIDQISRSVFNLKCAPAFTCNQIEGTD